MLEMVTAVNSALNGFVWGPVMLALLVGTGIYLTVRTGCLQARKFGYIMRSTVGSLFRGSKGRDKGAHGENLSPFQAVTTALAGTVGTGNIAGVTGAIFVGGPGAVFWMWFAAFFGMVTKYAEIVLALKFRQVDENGKHYGGPMYYIEKGLHMKWLAVMFALISGFACFGIGNIAQGNEIAGAMQDLFGVPALYTGIGLAVVVAVVVLGGVKRIGQVTSYLVPFMAVFYIAAGVGVVAMRFTQIPTAFAIILKSAFSLEAVGGGVFGYTLLVAMRQGFARGVFSNEAGLGSAPMAHAASSTQEPVEQGMWGVFEVFIDTIIICTITALAVVLSGVYTLDLDSFASKGAATAAAFNSILPGTVGGAVIQISLLFFALSTILGWSYYGERCWAYLSNNNPVVILIFKVLFVLVCVAGATGNGTLVWDISDTLNGMMAIPNLVALLLLSNLVVGMTKDYFKNPAAKKK